MTTARVLFDLIVAGIATAGFGLLFRAETKSLAPGALIGGIGYVLYDALVLEFGSAPVAAFAACLLVGAVSEAAARLLKSPTIVFATMGVIPLVPGYGLYQTMEYMVSQDYTRALATGMETLLVAGAIAMSLGFSTVIARRLLRMARRRGKAGRLG
jgi:uncharacterized membrane protein YjjB (DUF3815 family)